MPANALVILTKEVADNTALAGFLAAHGLKSISYPCIATEILPRDPTELVGGRRLAEFRVLVFTSKRGAMGLAPARQLLNQSQPLIACVGDTTARAVEEHLGLRCDILPAGNRTAAGLAEEILKRFNAPEPLLHVRGDKTTGTLKQSLESAGWSVDELIVYRNYRPDIAPLNLTGPAVVVFASPSAAANFFAANEKLRTELTCVAIGPATAAQLRSIGITDVHVSGRPDPQAIAEAVASCIKENVANEN